MDFAQNPPVNLWGEQTQSWSYLQAATAKSPTVGSSAPRSGLAHTPRCPNASQAAMLVVEVIPKQVFDISANQCWCWGGAKSSNSEVYKLRSPQTCGVKTEYELFVHSEKLNID